MRSRLAGLTAILSASIVLSGCASTEPSAADDGVLRIVASTDVYGDIVAQIAGDRAEVTSIIDSPSQDPHSFEADVAVQLALSRADIIIENGGGYDDFVEVLRGGVNNDAAEVLTVVDVVQGTGLVAEENEHVWYDLAAMAELATRIEESLASADPEGAADYAAGASAFTEGLTVLIDQQSALAARVEGQSVVVTEPVPLYLLAGAGLVDRTPPAFSSAVEEGTDVPPASLAQILELVETNAVQMLAYNAQTTGPETERVLRAASASGIPTVSFSETLPTGVSYLDWMGANLDALDGALQ